MIKIKLIYLDENLIGLEVTGHALSNIKGQDLVCAGVSSIITGGFNAFSDEDLESIELKEGYAKVILKNLSNQAKEILRTIYIQLMTIEEAHPQYVKIIENGGNK
jgi:hypothetical protein